MALSKLAQQFADEISLQDWSDAHIRIDRAGHDRKTDTKSSPNDPILNADEVRRVKINVMWVTAQVLGYNDPNFDVYEFAEACGINTQNSRGGRDGTYRAGLRSMDGLYQQPGTFKYDPLTEVVTTDTSDAYHANINCSLFQRGYQNMPIRKFPLGGVPGKWKPCQCISLSQG
ncbi:hypothetical protein G3I77_02080 [Streptomyces sp. D2-8]|uniref:hypothetical protein n=1 Tax=Streptomyces sp. D2-8 TaxID=2707767 RepID=UPI0020C03466|nr:hypothetical protein [Streptomyces sp. D2-8]MCK8431851.1 hypothetical protein [Streptomyces sp. D2-8]